MVIEMKNGKVFIWMQLLGFDKNLEDCGAKDFINKTGFVPDGVCALMCHSDFFHQHRGMDEEYVLSPDNCSYNATPRNPERERQAWTNYDLRNLVKSLKANGTELYASIFGTNLNNRFHNEWHNEHPEVLRHESFNADLIQENPYFILKRFADGTYYEDFFIDKVCQTLLDYDIKGIHLADAFCPANAGMMNKIDFSTDFVGQFLDYSGIILPQNIADTMGNDDYESEKSRSEWIYSNRRAEWIEFNAWRWEKFFSKLCSRLHAIDKEVMALAMYCTDPFETLYCIGIDLKRIVRAGVDYITANILPSSCYMMNTSDVDYYFNRYMAIAPLTAAHIDKNHLVSMLALQDSTEEWNVMQDLPCLHQKDMYTMMAYQLYDNHGSYRALDGYFLCLGDGISKEDWNWERERLEIALSADAESCVSPAMFWSEYAFDKMLEEYINTRRWTPHKLFYELANYGAHCAAAVKSDGLKNYSGTLVVPNFDMLSEEEKIAIADYDRGSVLCTASPGFDPAKYGITSDIIFTDRYSNYPLTVFAFNCFVSEETRIEIEKLLSVDDNTPNLEGDVRFVKEPAYTLEDTLTFSKVTKGVISAMAYLLNEINNSSFRINKQNIVLKMKDGAYRIYLFNELLVKYQRAFVISEKEIKDVRIISKFPVLPPRFIEKTNSDVHHFYNDEKKIKKSFEVKMQPGGVTIVDVYL